MPLWDARVMDAVATFQFPPRQAGRKAVLMMLAAYADFADRVGRGACPAVESTVARAANVEGRQAHRHVAALRASGHIKAVGLAPLEGGRYTVVYDVALDNETRLLWQAEVEGSFDTWSEEMLPVLGDGGENGHIALPPVTGDVRPNYQSQTPELLRSSGRACGATGSEEIGMALAPGKIEDDEPQGRQEVDEGLQNGPGRYGFELDTQKAQRGAQRRRGGSAGQRLAGQWRDRLTEHDWKLMHNHQRCIVDFNRHLDKTSVSEETFAEMIEAWWADPGLVSRLDPARVAYGALLYRDWKTVLSRVERSAAVDDSVYTAADTATSTKLKGLLGLE